MQLVRRLRPCAAAHPGFVATIGGYDGLHVGHQELIRRAMAQAVARGMQSLMLSFEPLPREFFARQSPPARLTNLRERVRLLSRSGLDVFCAMHFTRRLREVVAEDFAAMLGQGGVKRLVVGHDFRAARDAAATAEWLAAEGPRFGPQIGRAHV